MSESISQDIEEYGHSYKADESQSARKILEDMHQEIDRSIHDLGHDIAALRKRIEGKEAQIRSYGANATGGSVARTLHLNLNRWGRACH